MKRYDFSSFKSGLLKHLQHMLQFSNIMHYSCFWIHCCSGNINFAGNQKMMGKNFHELNTDSGPMYKAVKNKAVEAA